MTIYEYRQIIVPASILIPIVIVISRLGRMPAYAKCLLAYLVMTLLFNTTATILTWNRIRNLWIFHFYTIAESFLLLYYFKLILLNKSINTIIRILLWAFPLFCIINFLFLQSLYNFNTYTRPVEAIILIALCAVYWWQENEEDSERSWGNIPNNWFVTAIMLYFAGAFFMFLLFNYFISPQAIKKVNSIILDVHASFLLAMYLLMSVGFLQCRK